MRRPKATSASRCRGYAGQMLGICIAVAGFGLPPALATDIQDHRGTGILIDFTQADEQLRTIFDGTAVFADIGGRASQFAHRDGTRYALVAFPVRGNIKPERIGEPYCRGRLLTPEQAVFEENLSRQVTDKLVSRSLFKAWRSSGQIVNSKVLTRRVPDKDYAVSLCRVPDQGVTSAPVMIEPADIVAMQITVAGALFAGGEFAKAARRYRAIFDDGDNADMLVLEVISILESGDLDAGFERDERLQERLDDVTDTGLLERYETIMDQAVEAYMALPESGEPSG